MLDKNWPNLTHEETLEPDLPICDPHHHLWDKRVAPFYRDDRYLLDELLADTGSGHNIVSTVFVEARAMYREDGPEDMKPVGETAFVNGIAAMSASGQYGAMRACAGIVGHANLRLGDAVAAVLEAHIDAGGGRFRGIRHSASWDASDDVRNSLANPPRHMLLHDDFRAGFARLAPLNLSFEGWCYHPQIPDVTDLAGAFPDTTIILNHFGGPLAIGPYAGKQDEIFETWRRDITALAERPNVVAKLGGLNMDINGYGWHERERPPGSRELADATRRYFDHAIEQFGPERCLFESNFPVDKLSCGYNVLWNSFKRMTANYSAAEKAAMFHDTATRVYRL